MDNNTSENALRVIATGRKAWLFFGSDDHAEAAANLYSLIASCKFSEAELGRLVGEKQQIIAFWEQSNKPPRSDVLPKLARVLGVSVEALLSPASPTPGLIPRGGGPVGKVRKLFDEVSRLPRRQQDKIVEFLKPIVDEFKRKTG